MNPEVEQENWEEDTNDTEIMKNINSLLDSGKRSSSQKDVLDTFEISGQK